LRTKHREPSAAAWFGKEDLVQWRERATARGIPDVILVADRKVDARPQTGTAPDGNTDMREPANKSLLTDVSRLAPTVARSAHRQPLTLIVLRGRAVAPLRLDLGHKRMTEFLTQCR
jgi:hypothetical protein